MSDALRDSIEIAIQSSCMQKSINHLHGQEQKHERIPHTNNYFLQPNNTSNKPKQNNANNQ